MKVFNVGILGLGYIGASHIDAVRRIPNCRLVAVADTNIEFAKARAEQYGIEKYYGSPEELLADPDIHVIHNCTPNHLHTDINRAIIESGKHLFSEKPLSRNYDEALALLETSKAHPEVVCAVNFNYRMNPLVQEMRSRIKKGELGDVRIVSGAYQQQHMMYDTDYNWRFEPEFSGISCTVADIGSHWMDLVQHVTGAKIVSVMADLVTTIPVRKKAKKQVDTFSNAVCDEYELKNIEMEDYGAVLFKMDNGATGLFHVSQVSAGHGCCFGVEFNGSKCSYRWNQEENDRLWIGLRGDDNRYVIRDPNYMTPEAKAVSALAMGHPEGWNDAFCGNIRAFYEYLASDRANTPSFASLEEASYIIRLTEAIVKSSKEKRWIEV